MAVGHGEPRLPRHTVLLLIAAMLVGACDAIGGPRDLAADAAALEAAFPALEQADVSDYQDWSSCHSIVLGGILYTDGAPPIECYLVQASPHPLEGPPLDTFRAIRRAFETAGVPVLNAALLYDPAGGVVSANFDLPCPSACEFGSYIFERGGYVSDKYVDTGPGVTTIPIKPEWVWHQEP